MHADELAGSLVQYQVSILEAVRSALLYKITTGYTTLHVKALFEYVKRDKISKDKQLCATRHRIRNTRTSLFILVFN